MAKGGMRGRGGVHGGGYVWQGSVRGGGVHSGETATEAGVTHPTGMYSSDIYNPPPF